jgi:hypothetical protein
VSLENFRTLDIILLKAETMVIIVGWRRTPLHRDKLPGRRDYHKASRRLRLQPERAIGDWGVFFIPNGGNPLKSTDSKK